MKRIIFCVCSLLSLNAYTEINSYQSTDNTGLNKREQIETIEKYLIDLSGQLKKLEGKIEEHGEKFRALEKSIQEIKENASVKKEDKQALKKIPEKENPADIFSEELEKIKADVLSLKNKDIEVMGKNIRDLEFSLKNIQNLLKISPP